MGAARKVLSLQSGNWKKDELQKKQLEEEAVIVASDQLKKPPAWLRDGVAKKEWIRLVEIMEDIKIIGNLDFNALGAYCNAFSSYVEATKELKGQPLIVDKITKFGVQRVQNPLLRVQQDATDEMKKASSQIGIDVNSRLKLAHIKRQSTPDNGNEFGDI